MPRTDHSNCPHEATKAARATCRKARAERTAMTTCPNHSTIAQDLLESTDRGKPFSHFSICGCYRTEGADAFARHAFRFFAGDRGSVGPVGGGHRHCAR